MPEYAARKNAAHRRAHEGGLGPASLRDAFSSMNSAAVTVRQERCAVVRNRNVTCLKCAQACTSDCITLKDGMLSIDASKCVGCGTCATVCPTCALEAQNPNDATLTAQASRNVYAGSVTIACKPLLEACGTFIDKDRIAQVVCLGRVEESLLIGLVAQGVKNINLVCGACENCAQTHGANCARMIVENTNILLEAWENTAQISLSSKVPETVLTEKSSAAQVKNAIESYFAVPRGNKALENKEEDAAKEQSKQATREHLLRVMRDGTLSHFVPDRRERLLNALAELGEPKVKSIKTRLWGNIVIDLDLCESCRMCATFCPTGAIRKFDNPDGTFGVQHFPEDCVKCGSCRDICPADAITIFDDVKISCLLDGDMHTYTMRPRAVSQDDPHKILKTIRPYFNADVFER